MPKNCAGVIKAILREGSSCSLGISKERVAQYHIYDETLIEDLVGLGIDRDVAYNSIPVSFVLHPDSVHLPKFICLKRSSPIRKKMLDYFYNCIVKKTPITKKGLFEASGTDRAKWSFEDYDFHYTSSAATHAKTGFQNQKKFGGNRLGKIALSRDGVPTTNRTVGGGIISLNAKISHLSSVNSTGLNNILLRLIEKGYADDEYTAHCIIYKWAAERLKSEEMG